MTAKKSTPQKKAASTPVSVAKSKVTATVTFAVEIKETCHIEERTAERGVVRDIDFQRERIVYVAVPSEKAEAFDAKEWYSEVRDAAVAEYADPTLAKIEVISVARVKDAPSIFIG